MNIEKLRAVEDDLNAAADEFRAHAGACTECNAERFEAGDDCEKGNALWKAYSHTQRKLELAKKLPLKPSLKVGTIDLSPTEQPEVCGRDGCTEVVHMQPSGAGLCKQGHHHAIRVW